MNVKSIFLFILLFSIFLSFAVMAEIPAQFQRLIDKGEFTIAQQLMREELASNLTMEPLQRLEISFEIERLDRIKKDFTRTRKDVISYIKEYYPNVSDDEMQQWEQTKELEYWIIDGEKRYFNRAAPNLFRINKKMKEIKKKKTSSTTPPVYAHLADVQSIINQSQISGKKFVNQVRARVNYTINVEKDAVPSGKTIRCWMPFPREISERQTDVELISSDPERFIISDNDDFLQRSIYLEKTASAGLETKFNIVFEYTSHAVHQKIDPNVVKPVKPTLELKPFLEERPPHVVFSDDMRALSEKIIGKETNPYLKAKKIFKYINDNIPWASAREYSTIANISDYVLKNKHCDCGMHSIFFITLCRMNGIPTRWQSGWSTIPGQENMHDWGAIYFEPYGWLPVDPDFGLMDSKNEDEKYFYIGSMDAHRLIINDDYSRPLYPTKIHHRSETVDFQRGEVEWEGGNLYFDQWDWDFNVEYMKE